jgi:hypothetical protein
VPLFWEIWVKNAVVIVSLDPISPGRNKRKAAVFRRCLLAGQGGFILPIRVVVMSAKRKWLLLPLILVFVSPRSAYSQPPAKPPADPGASLAGQLKIFLGSSLPDPLFEDASHWNRQKPWRGKPRNEGRWYKVKATGRNLPGSLVVEIRDIKKVDKSRTTFTCYLALDANVQLDRQTWHRGVRIYSASTRARLRAMATMQCEITARVEGNGLLPDTILRLRVIESNLRYDNLVVEHTAGVGGDAAKIIGEAIIGGARQFKPSLERKFLAKANASVVKAADTKEIRIGLSSLMGGK